MKYEIAKKIGESILSTLQPYIEKGVIAGSIRRHKAEVKDIDLIIIPKREFMVMENIKTILNSYGKINMEGNLIIRAEGENELKIDCYIANHRNYEILLLIRTGSKAHNIKLAQLALSQGKQLKFSEGLIDKETKRLLSKTEKGVFENLGLPYLEPKDRD